jgi:hypothetical protein
MRGEFNIFDRDSVSRRVVRLPSHVAMVNLGFGLLAADRLRGVLLRIEKQPLDDALVGVESFLRASKKNDHQLQEISAGLITAAVVKAEVLEETMAEPGLTQAVVAAITEGIGEKKLRLEVSPIRSEEIQVAVAAMRRFQET